MTMRESGWKVGMYEMIKPKQKDYLRRRGGSARCLQSDLSWPDGVDLGNRVGLKGQLYPKIIQLAKRLFFQPSLDRGDCDWILINLTCLKENCKKTLMSYAFISKY